MVDVHAINRAEAIILLDDGQVLPIVLWIDEDGPCEPEEAAAAVAGPDGEGRWFSVNLTKFEPARVH